ncbi:MAG: GTP-binding protein [Acetobacteraceae bacterium]|jgi:predicted GTPase
MRAVILGAAGRDFHNFNTVYRDDPASVVVAFTATQIPGIADRTYPAALAGPRYPAGIPIVPEERLEDLCRAQHVDQVVFAYSDVPHTHVMHLASRALAAGADFVLLGPQRTMLTASRPVIAVSGLRTGCGKSPISRWLAAHLRARGRRVAVIRHPMPYGNLAMERVQRFAVNADLDAAQCTIEEREEYEPHLACGDVVFAGVDYAAILRAAEAEADILVWDGGNNDFPFIRPDLHIGVADALRPDQVTTHHPGETVARMADVLVVNKFDAASAADVAALTARLRAINPHAAIVHGSLPVRLDNPEAVRGRRVLVIEDGPTLTHGGMAYGAGAVAARAAGAAELVDPRLSAPPEMLTVFTQFPHIGKVLPALGYSETQRRALARTIDDSEAELVVAATPIDLARLISISKPIVRVRYKFAEDPANPLSAIVDVFLTRR